MNNQQKNDHYIYFLIDKYNTVRYVGHGRAGRVYEKSHSRRSNQYIDILNDSGTIVKIHTDLTKDEAIQIENFYLDNYINTQSREFNLINVSPSQNRKIIKFDEMDKLFEIDSKSPTFLIWKVNPSKRIKKGSVAGSKDKDYYRTYANKVRYPVHRIVYSLHNRCDLHPNDIINHIDHNTFNNSPCNLEKTTYQGNRIHSQQRNSKTGVENISRVTRNKYNEYFMVKIVRDGKTIVRKYFSITSLGEDRAMGCAKEFLKFFELLQQD